MHDPRVNCLRGTKSIVQCKKSLLLKEKYKIKSPLNFVNYLHFHASDILNDSKFKFSLSFSI